MLLIIRLTAVRGESVKKKTEIETKIAKKLKNIKVQKITKKSEHK